MRIERRKVDDLKPAEYNPRKISDNALAGLETSVKRFGLVQPIVINERTGNIVGGHQRLKVVCDEEIDCVIVDLDESEEKALNVALNNPHIQGEWDVDKLDSILREISDIDVYKDLKLDKLEVIMPEDVAKNEIANVPVYEVVIECTSEGEQKSLYDEFSDRGLKCRVLTL